MVAKLVIAGAAAATIGGFGISASLPASADEFMYQEAFDEDLDVAHDKANEMCVQIGFARGRDAEIEPIVDASGATVYRVVMQCLGPNGEQMISSDFGIASTEEEAFQKAVAACEARGFVGLSFLYGDPVPGTNEFLVAASCGEPGVEEPIIY